MKIIVFSDSHGLYNNMTDAVKHEEPELIIHCGDHERDARQLEKKFKNIPVHSVVGNCDFGYGGKTEEEFTVMGKKFFITHGHLYRVKSGYMNFVYAAREKNADVAICGHTHIPLHEELYGIHIINPGSITYGACTYGVIDITEDSFKYRLVEMFPDLRSRGRRR